MSNSTLKPTINLTKNKYQCMTASIEFGNIYVATMNRPKKYNALNDVLYDEIQLCIKEAKDDERVIAFCLTGNGDYFSSGNDLGNFTKKMMNDDNGSDSDTKIRLGTQKCGEFVSAFIDMPKPLIALVNGPVIGIACTVLALFDMVLATDKATFLTPFTSSALSPEGCSSYTFPKLMGRIKAAQMLIFNKKLSAQEAFQCGLVSEVIEDSNFESVSKNRLQMISQLPRESLMESRNCLRYDERDILHAVNKREMEILTQRFQSGEFMQSVIAFMNKPKKSKL